MTPSPTVGQDCYTVIVTVFCSSGPDKQLGLSCQVYFCWLDTAVCIRVDLRKIWQDLTPDLFSSYTSFVPQTQWLENRFQNSQTFLLWLSRLNLKKEKVAVNQCFSKHVNWSANMYSKPTAIVLESARSKIRLTQAQGFFKHTSTWLEEVLTTFKME